MYNLTLREMLNYVPVKNYEDRYMVSKHGSIYSLRTSKNLKPVLCGSKEIVTLYKDKVKKNVTVSRVVAEHFLHDGREGKYKVVHIDKDTTNNNVNNLEIIYLSH